MLEKETPHEHECPGCARGWQCHNRYCVDPTYIWCESGSCIGWPPRPDQFTWRRTEALRSVRNNLEHSIFVLRTNGLPGFAASLEREYDTIRDTIIAANDDVATKLASMRGVRKPTPSGQADKPGD